MKKLNRRFLVALSLFLTLILASCGGEQDKASNSKEDTSSTYKVGVVGDVEREVWEEVAKLTEKEGVHLEVEVFDDYVQPNKALADGSLDLNACQHLAYLLDFAESEHAEVEPLAYTYISPMAAYSEKVDSLNDLEDGAQIAIPNDVTNGGRALLLLDQAGLIEVDEAAGLSPTSDDILDNPKNIEIIEVDPAQVPRSLADVDVAIANTNYAVDSGLSPYEDGIFVDTEDLSQVGAQYKNVIAIRSEDANQTDFQVIINAYQSEEILKKIKEVSNGADDQAWSEDDDILSDFHSLKK